ncbi:DUF1045 domain-containing protein [Roseovarius sp. LXJ103]|uniref:DUF1045 domain-containing protein n=1 Tax=Roseovarius carneus TaxID=2853164 RepID=UPI000D6172D2|nr:DUF1045 domain-containing protein [Roseovarius carneus]MBZ8119919.1 DUF1045 domain-containing protein [Roseovarius carneus]PWE34489.1 phosphonate metabolism protein [Pelagicola sp. LXJ1103]
MSYSRFAIYYVPPVGAWADFGASWLGWDVLHGREAPQPDMPGLDDITMTPRKYGFHATLKPPFRLAEGQDVQALKAAVSDLAVKLAPAICEGLELTTLGGFLALTPQNDMQAVRRVAGACVRALDRFRAPALEAELARRRKVGLSPPQEALLAQWGYPYVMEEFRFHMTLTARLPQGEIAVWSAALRRHMPDLPSPFVLDQIALCGEREDGRFEVLHRYKLTG